MLNRIDRIRIINLTYRRDRRQEMEAELRKIGLADDPRVEFFPAIRPDDAGDFTSIGARGVYESQRAILREAAAANRSVLILEDDCQFTARPPDDDAADDWDIYYGGHYASDPNDLQGSDIAGAHMMAFTAQCAGRVTDYLDRLTYQGIHPPIDAAYIWFRRAHPDIRAAFAVPPLAVQRSSRSDISDRRFYDRGPLRPLAALARRLIRKG